MKVYAQLVSTTFVSFFFFFEANHIYYFTLILVILTAFYFGYSGVKSHSKKYLIVYIVLIVIAQVYQFAKMIFILKNIDFESSF